MTLPLPINLDNATSIRRHETKHAAELLTKKGFKTAPTTLAKLRCVGGGPEFVYIGAKPFYEEPALLEWAQSKTSAPRRTTLGQRRSKKQPVVAVCVTAVPSDEGEADTSSDGEAS